MIFPIQLCVLTIAAAFLLRLYLGVCAKFRRRLFLQDHVHRLALQPPDNRSLWHLLCVLGSGGHTAEMLTMVSDVRAMRANPIKMSFIVTETDRQSVAKLSQLPEIDAPTNDTSGGFQVFKIPRAREVGQSWVSSMYPSMLCLATAIPIVAKTRPDVLLLNGPGTAVLVAAVCCMFRVLGIVKTRIVYVESVARTRDLSMSGMLIYYLADRFIVQWEQLRERYPLSELHGRIS